MEAGSGGSRGRKLGTESKWGKIAEEARKGRERKGSVADADRLFSSFVGSGDQEGRKKEEESPSVTSANGHRLFAALGSTFYETKLLPILPIQ